MKIKHIAAFAAFIVFAALMFGCTEKSGQVVDVSLPPNTPTNSAAAPQATLQAESTPAPTAEETPAATPTVSAEPTATPVVVEDNGLPYYIYVEKGSFTLTIYGKNELGEYNVPIYAYKVAHGGNRTPAGVFTLGEIEDRERWHEFPDGGFVQFAVNYHRRLYLHSPLYGDTNNKMLWPKYYDGELGIGTDGTGGCLRMVTEAARFIYENCPPGTVLEIVNGSPRGTVSENPPSRQGKRQDPTDIEADTTRYAYVQKETAPAVNKDGSPKLNDDGTPMMLKNELLDLRRVLPNAEYELLFNTENNVLGRKLYGKSIPLLQAGTADKLKLAYEKFLADGYILKIYDAYRPFSVQVLLFDEVQNSSWIANPNTNASHHNRGAAVDISLVSKKTGEGLDFPTPMHTFAPESGRASETWTQAQRENVEYLTKIMQECGFNYIQSEWWHYSDVDANTYMTTDLDLTNLTMKTKYEIYLEEKNEE